MWGISQEASVFRRLSVEDNIKAVLEMTDLKKDEQAARCEALIEEFRLQKVRRKSLGIQLSGGERRRTEIARAVAINPASSCSTNRSQASIRSLSKTSRASSLR